MPVLCLLGTVPGAQSNEMNMSRVVLALVEHMVKYLLGSVFD